MTWSKFIAASIVLTAIGLTGYVIHDVHPLERPETWQLVYQPGALSHSHAFLSHQCTACHTPPIKGVTTVGCVTCHADNQKLLKRQSTAFHAHVTSCKECHREHQGGEKPPLTMDHESLASIGLRIATKKEPNLVRINPHESVLINQLNCATCHGNQDRHRGLFGTTCISCHSTQSWKIAEYRHPSPNNRACAQCHQAPPSHYMGHFEMVSEKVAGIEHAQVNQCFLCHRTTSWNDIQGVGWYKHH